MNVCVYPLYVFVDIQYYNVLVQDKMATVTSEDLQRKPNPWLDPHSPSNEPSKAPLGEHETHSRNPLMHDQVIGIINVLCWMFWPIYTYYDTLTAPSEAIQGTIQTIVPLINPAVSTMNVCAHR